MKRNYATMLLMVTALALTNAVLVYELWAHIELGTSSCLAGVLK